MATIQQQVTVMNLATDNVNKYVIFKTLCLEYSSLSFVIFKSSYNFIVQPNVLPSDFLLLPSVLYCFVYSFCLLSVDDSMLCNFSFTACETSSIKI